MATLSRLLHARLATEKVNSWLMLSVLVAVGVAVTTKPSTSWGVGVEVTVGDVIGPGLAVADPVTQKAGLDPEEG